MKRLLLVVGLVGLAIISVTVAPRSSTAADSSCEYPDGTLLRPDRQPETSVIDKCRAWLIPSVEVFESYGYRWEDVQVAYKPVHELIWQGNLLREEGDDRVYYVQQSSRPSYKIWIPTPAAFLAGGFKSVEEDVRVVNSLEMEHYSDENFVRLYLTSGNRPVYILYPNGTKRLILNEEILKSYGRYPSWISVVEGAYSGIVTERKDAVLVRKQGDYKVYLLSGLTKQWIRTAEAFERLGYRWGDIVEITEVDFAAYTEVGVIE